MVSKKSFVICVFGYNRSEEIREVLDALSLCDHIDDFVVWAFVDGPRGKDDQEKVESVCSVVDDFSNLIDRRFISSQNRGLRASLVRGIKIAAKDFDGFVVIEDDIVLSSQALTFAKKMLESYGNDPSVYHVNLWNFPVVQSAFPYFSAYMHCWGWASWSDRWDDVDFTEKPYRSLSFFDRVRISKYFSTLHFSHLYSNYVGIKKTWAIFWLVHIFNFRGKCISPPSSLSINIGFDSGEHKESYKFLQSLTNKDLGDLLTGSSVKWDVLSWFYSLYKTPKVSLINSIRLMIFK